jgi:uncharacterized membrane protein YfcA
VHFSWALLVAGVFVGVSVGLTGMGGGALMTPVLVLVVGVPPGPAVGSDLLASVAMKPVAAAVHQRARTVRWELVRWLVPTAVPAGFAGAFLLRLFGAGAVLAHRLEIALGAALLLSVAGMGARPLLARRCGPSEAPGSQRVAVRRVPTLAIGLAGGLVVGMTSVGSGSLIMVMLMLAHPRLRAADLVGTDLVQAVPLVAAAAAGHLVAGDTHLTLSGLLLLGAIPGVMAGALGAARAPSGLLRWILAVLLLASGLALIRLPSIVTGAACAALIAAGLAARARRRGRGDSDRAEPPPRRRAPPRTRLPPTPGGNRLAGSCPYVHRREEG